MDSAWLNVWWPIIQTVVIAAVTAGVLYKGIVSGIASAGAATTKLEQMDDLLRKEIQELRTVQALQRADIAVLQSEVRMSWRDARRRTDIPDGRLP